MSDTADDLFYVIHEYDGARQINSLGTYPSDRVRFLVTYVRVPEQRYDCENYRAAVAAAVYKTDWVRSDGFQMQDAAYMAADREAHTAAQVANIVHSAMFEVFATCVLSGGVVPTKDEAVQMFLDALAKASQERN